MILLNIIIFNVKRVFKEKGEFISTIIKAVLFMLFMGIVFRTESNEINISVADNDQGIYSQYLIEYLNSNDNIKIKLKSDDAVKDDIKNSISSIGYIIPQNFSEKIESGDEVEINLVISNANTEELIISSLIDNYVSKLRASYIATKSKGNNNSEVIFNDHFNNALEGFLNGSAIETVSEVYNTADSRAEKNKMNVGYTIFFIMMIAIYSMIAILKERQEGTLLRLLSTPAKKIEIILGYFAGVLVQGYIQICILVVITSLLFKTYWGNSYLLLFVLLSVFLFAAIGMGLMLAGLVNTYTQLDALVLAILIPTSMLAGVFWPIEYMPQFMQKAAYITPQYWAIRGVSILSNNTDIHDVFIPIIVLISFTVLFISLGTVKLKKVI